METMPRFYQGSMGFEGTGRDRERHPVAVRLRSETCVLQTAHAWKSEMARDLQELANQAKSSGAADLAYSAGSSFTCETYVTSAIYYGSLRLFVRHEALPNAG
jgi:hypothetical protein